MTFVEKRVIKQRKSFDDPPAILFECIKNQDSYPARLCNYNRIGMKLEINTKLDIGDRIDIKSISLPRISNVDFLYRYVGKVVRCNPCLDSEFSFFLVGIKLTRVGRWKKKESESRRFFKIQSLSKIEEFIHSKKVLGAIVFIFFFLALKITYPKNPFFLEHANKPTEPFHAASFHFLSVGYECIPGFLVLLSSMLIAYFFFSNSLPPHRKELSS
jgi:hypothetical protein